MALLHSTWFYITLACSTSLYLTLFYSTLALLNSTWLYITLHCLYFSLLGSRLLYIGCTSLYLTLYYYDSTSLYLSLHYSAMALLHCTWLNITLHWPYTLAIHHSYWLYITLLWLYFILLESTLLYHSSTSHYFTLD